MKICSESSGTGRMAITLGIISMLYSIGACVWMVLQKNDSDKLLKLKEYQLELDCHDCVFKSTAALSDKCERIKESCSKRGFSSNEVISLQNCNFTEFVNQAVEAELKSSWKKFYEYRLTNKEKNALHDMDKAFYETNLTIIRASPYPDRTKPKHGHWNMIKKFGPHSNVPPTQSNESNSEGRYLTVPRRGLYMVFARLTFACEEIDRHPKRVEMRVQVRYGKSSYYILYDSQTATCNMKEDLLTTHQTSTYRLDANSKIYLEYKLPPNVSLSMTDVEQKSSFNLVELGKG